MADLRWKRAMLFTVVLLVIAAGSVIANGTSSEPAPAEKMVTLQLSDTPVIDVIDYLFNGTGYKYTIEPGVSGRISVGFKDMPLEQAVKAVADASNLDYTKTPGRYIFKPKSKTPVVAETPYQDQNQPAEQPNNEYKAKPDNSGGPVYYGTLVNENTIVNENLQYPHVPLVPPILDVGGIKVLDYPYGGIYDLSPYSSYYGAHDIFVPPGYVSPSLQRFYDSISAAHSVPGFPVWGPDRSVFSGHRYPY